MHCRGITRYTIQMIVQHPLMLLRWLATSLQWCYSLCWVTFLQSTSPLFGWNCIDYVTEYSNVDYAKKYSDMIWDKLHEERNYDPLLFLLKRVPKHHYCCKCDSRDIYMTYDTYGHYFEIIILRSNLTHLEVSQMRGCLTRDKISIPKMTLVLLWNPQMTWKKYLMLSCSIKTKVETMQLRKSEIVKMCKSYGQSHMKKYKECLTESVQQG